MYHFQKLIFIHWISRILLVNTLIFSNEVNDKIKLIIYF